MFSQSQEDEDETSDEPYEQPMGAMMDTFTFDTLMDLSDDEDYEFNYVRGELTGGPSSAVRQPSEKEPSKSKNAPPQDQTATSPPKKKKKPTPKKQTTSEKTKQSTPAPSTSTSSNDINPSERNGHQPSQSEMDKKEKERLLAEIDAKLRDDHKKKNVKSSINIRRKSTNTNQPDNTAPIITKKPKDVDSDENDLSDFMNIHRKSNKPDIKVQEVIRKKSERRKLEAHECEDCKAFYDSIKGVFKNEADRKRVVQKCGRHRSDHVNSKTPDWYWSLNNSPTNEDLNDDDNFGLEELSSTAQSNRPSANHSLTF
ncbi:hypothetical protein AKO1_008155 [Acrasis kona]|uniref:DNA endonuclease activator Ctp1 C-terminal domain-containing protein n=1 Tax=Acrasis kona TaxID=1008807 RepID=A0AAW2YP14_9EUKA